MPKMGWEVSMSNVSRWGIRLLAAALPVGMAASLNNGNWSQGVGTAIGWVIITLILLRFAPKIAGEWAIGFSAGSALALVIGPVKGYPMYDVGFAIQGIGAYLVSLQAPYAVRNKRWAKLSNEAVLQGEYKQRAEVHYLTTNGVLVGRGEVYPLLVTIPEQAGPGTAVLKPNGPLVFTLDSSGRSHEVERKCIKAVEEVKGNKYIPAGHLMFTFVPAIPFSLSLEPFPNQRADWLALSPKKNSAS
ncbi:hypothetical protein OG901_30190 [Streptomyces mirabilis]|uniref:hypothetical protein n=1 Tax=Streptomyces mirabilis TaxID=68239 RepID=UPI00224DE186|nr:hypothetical protein [Streptomyces mirabilis]MCX5351987.1 hypothetical protein [Streptomyces mirabilis]